MGTDRSGRTGRSIGTGRWNHGVQMTLRSHRLAEKASVVAAPGYELDNRALWLAPPQRPWIRRVCAPHRAECRLPGAPGRRPRPPGIAARSRRPGVKRKPVGPAVRPRASADLIYTPLCWNCMQAGVGTTDGVPLDQGANISFTQCGFNVCARPPCPTHDRRPDAPCAFAASASGYSAAMGTRRFAAAMAVLSRSNSLAPGIAS